MPANPNWIPAMTCGGETFEASLPMRPFERENQAEGGSRTADSGFMATFVRRRDRRLRLTLRVREGAELEALEAVIDAYHGGARPLTVYLSGLAGSGHACYLEAPKVGEAFRPPRAGSGDRSIHEPAIEVRKVSGERWAEVFFAEA